MSKAERCFRCEHDYLSILSGWARACVPGSALHLNRPGGARPPSAVSGRGVCWPARAIGAKNAPCSQMHWRWGSPCVNSEQAGVMEGLWQPVSNMQGCYRLWYHMHAGRSDVEGVLVCAGEVGGWVVCGGLSLWHSDFQLPAVLQAHMRQCWLPVTQVLYNFGHSADDAAQLYVRFCAHLGRCAFDPSHRESTVLLSMWTSYVELWGGWVGGLGARWM